MDNLSRPGAIIYMFNISDAMTCSRSRGPISQLHRDLLRLESIYLFTHRGENGVSTEGTVTLGVCMLPRNRTRGINACYLPNKGQPQPRFSIVFWRDGR